MFKKKNILIGLLIASTALNLAADLQLPKTAIVIAASTDVKANIEQLLKSKCCPGCFLSYVDLNGADLTSASLFKANLSGANFKHANLFKANLRSANLFKASFSDANLSYANLRGANLFYTDLSYANLTGANLKHANLYKANLTDTKLKGVNLIGATGLDTAIYKKCSWSHPLEKNKADKSNAELIALIMAGKNICE